MYPFPKLDSRTRIHPGNGYENLYPSPGIQYLYRVTLYQKQRQTVGTWNIQAWFCFYYSKTASQSARRETERMEFTTKQISKPISLSQERKYINKSEQNRRVGKSKYAEKLEI